MKKSYSILMAAIAALFLSPDINAQENINSTVEVKREFEGKLLEISKSKLDMKYSDTLMRLNLNFDYSVFDRPYKDLYEFSPMESAHIQREGLIRYPILYAKLAVSYPWMPEADIYLQPRLGNKFSLLFYGNHRSFWGHDKDDATGISPVNRMTNKAGLKAGFNWKKGEITLGGSYSHDKYDFIGNVGNFRFFHQIGADLRVRSVDSDPTAFYYDIKAGYLGTKDDMTIPDLTFGGVTVENRVDADMLFGMTLKRIHKILLEIKSSTSGYSILDRGTGSTGNFEITPQYRFDYKRWRFKAGLSFAGRYGTPLFTRDTSETGLATVYPNVSVSFEAAKNALWIYAVVDGENRLNTFSTYLEQSPWISPVYFPSGNLSIPIRTALGLNGVVNDKFSYSLSGTYSHYRQYMNYYCFQSLSGVYSMENVDEVSTKAEMLFKTKPFTAGLSGRYSYFFGKMLYMTPAFKLDFFAKYNYRERIFLEINLKYHSRMHGCPSPIVSSVERIDVPGFVDMGAVITYSINSKFSVFAQGKNLLNQKIFYVQNYLEPGINFGLGLFFKL